MIFSMLKYYPNIIAPPEECKDDTSLRLDNYSCSNNELILNLKNNGLFNVDGFILQVGNDSRKFPIDRIDPTWSKLDFGAGYYIFNNSIKPGEIQNANFTMKENISVLQIQAMILDEEEQKIPCESIIKQPIYDCAYS